VLYRLSLFFLRFGHDTEVMLCGVFLNVKWVLLFSGTTFPPKIKQAKRIFKVPVVFVMEAILVSRGAAMCKSLYNFEDIINPDQN
jgi:hypothetical protein